MARLPYITSRINRHQIPQEEFRGLDQSLVAPSGSFADMTNASSRYFPAITARKPRGTTETALAKPNGLIYKNGLFYVDGTRCVYNGNVIAGLTVSDSRKTLVGMGAYICIFPDKKVYNTHTGEVKYIDASYTQSGSMTFEELTEDSVFTKITASGIHNSFSQGDAVSFTGVNDDAFPDNTSRVISEAGTGYIVVTAPIQKTYTGEVEILSHATNRIRIAGPGSDMFSVGDTARISGCEDTALNVSGAVTSATADYIVIAGTFPAKSYTQGGVLYIGPYYNGSDLTRIYGADINDVFKTGDVVTISGCSNASVNGSHEIIQAGTDYIIIDAVTASDFTQSSGITMTRTKAKYKAGIVKRTGFSRSSGIKIERSSQDFDYVCEFNNRLWACNSENHEIYASKLGDPTNWNCFEGISTDSYAVTVGSDGDFTGCIAHQGHVIFFKENTIHMMYGDRPANFALNTSQLPGVMEGCSDSIEVINETLYYVGRNGVYAFDGAIPQKISETIKDELTEAVSAQEEGKLYLSCKMAGTQAVLCFDPRLGFWNKENDDTFKFATYGDGRGCFINADGTLTYITGDDTDRIDWMIESPDIREGSIFTKYISKLLFNFWLAEGTVATVYLKCDDSPLWVRKGSITADEDKTYTMPITPQRCHKYRYRIEFHGDGKLISSMRYAEGGTELNGTVHHGYRGA